MLLFIIIFAGLCYAAYRILRHAAPQMRTQAALNKLVAKNKPVYLGGHQPHYDHFAFLSNEFRTKEVLQLERVFESGYRVTADGQWRG